MPRTSQRNQDVHVFRDAATGSWVFRFGGVCSDQFVTQRDAASAAKVLAKYHECDLVIHGRDGKIRQKDSYGGDSPRRRG